jgi:ABC-type Fe3+/spermidine/putrescine transport system ATPase subunit
MATRIAVMDKGAVQQVATPSELYEHPRTKFVADFIGKVNLLDAAVKGKKAKALSLDAKGIGKFEIGFDKEAGSAVTIALRPEKLNLTKEKPSAKGEIAMAGTVKDVAYYGDTSQVIVTVADNTDLEVSVQNDSRLGGAGVKVGQKIWASFNPEDAIVLTE